MDSCTPEEASSSCKSHLSAGWRCAHCRELCSGILWAGSPHSPSCLSCGASRQPQGQLLRAQKPGILLNNLTRGVLPVGSATGSILQAHQLTPQAINCCLTISCQLASPAHQLWCPAGCAESPAGRAESSGSTKGLLGAGKLKHQQQRLAAITPDHRSCGVICS